MVVIEEPEGIIEKKPDPSKPSAATHSTANADSDGFETASEGEVDAADDHTEHQKPREEGDGMVPPEESTSSQACDSQVSDDESNQKALAQANEAKLEGNKLFADGQFEEALSKYELSLKVAPDIPASMEIKSICYANRAICLLKMGKYEDTITECTRALELNPTYEKALLRRAEAHEKLEHFDEAIADFKKILELDPSNVQAKKTIVRLEPLAAEKREKMKEEMIGKLKDMGNSLLGRFGMSLDNFKAVKDPNTGSYSISFQK